MNGGRWWITDYIPAWLPAFGAGAFTATTLVAIAAVNIGTRDCTTLRHELEHTSREYQELARHAEIIWPFAYEGIGLVAFRTLAAGDELLVLADSAKRARRDVHLMGEVR